MKASELLKRYAAGERNFQRVNLRGQSFKGRDLSGADFSEADIRSTNFTGANLRKAKFSGAKAGLKTIYLFGQIIISLLVLGASGFMLVVGGHYVANLMMPKVIEKFSYLPGILSFFVIAVILITFVLKGFTEEGFEIVAIAVSFFIMFLVGSRAIYGLEVLGTLSNAAGGGSGALFVAIASSILITIAGTVGGSVWKIIASAIEAIVAILLVIGIVLNEGYDIIAYKVFIILITIVLVSSSILIAWRALVEEDEKFTLIRKVANAAAARRGTSFRGANLTDANFTGAKLRGTDFRDAILTRVRWYGAKKLERVRPGDTYLKTTQVRKWLIGEGQDNNFDGKDLRGVNLQGVNLRAASFVGSNLSEANLQDADLSRAKLVQTLLEGADLTGAILTGACIEDWGISSTTRLIRLNCEHIYLKEGEQERRPASGKFEPGEFAKLVEKYIETVDLIFKDGIDWRAFLDSFQDLRVEYGEQNVSIQAIEKKSDGAFVIRLSVPPEADKAEIESKAKQSYETKLQVLEAQYRTELKAKDIEINIYKQQSTDMMEIVKLQAGRPINVEAGEVTNRKIYANEYRETHLHDESRSIETRNSSTYYENYNPSDQTLAEVAAEIQKLLKQLEKSNPTATEDDKIAYVNDETPPSFKRKAAASLKAAGETAIDEFFDNPFVKVGKAIIMAWI